MAEIKCIQINERHLTKDSTIGDIVRLLREEPNMTWFPVVDTLSSEPNHNENRFVD